MGNKVDARSRRKQRTRKKVAFNAERPRVSVFRSGKHTYAQIIVDETGATLTAASTRDKEVLTEIGNLPDEASHSEVKTTKSVRAARAVGIVLARRAVSKNIAKVVFDRNGFLFHGRIKALADGAREGGLDF